MMQIADLPNPGLTERLLEDQDAPGSAQLASSHWRQMHARAVAGKSQSRLVLQGFGFGNMRSCHPLQLPLEWLTWMSYAARSDSPAEIFRNAWRLRGLLRKQTPEMRLKLTYDAVRQVFVWQTIKPFLQQRRPLKWCIIGDGFGLLAALVKELQPDARLVLIDLPKTLVFQSVYVQMMHPGASHSLLEEGKDADFVYCRYPDFPETQKPFDLFVNVASMQEMSRHTVGKYFEFMRATGAPDHRFYCCNRVEKQLPDGEVIRFEDYPWSERDEILMDGPCGYQSYFFHLRTLPLGPKIFGVRVPFVNEYDGRLRHRIAVLK